MAARGIELAQRIGFGRRERNLLLLTAFGLWLATYANLNFGWSTPTIDYQAERALRRIATCIAGVGLCLATIPALARASLEPLGRQLCIAAAITLAAYLAHLCIRLAVFHLYRPLWGPLNLEVVRQALGGDGWMFGFWSIACLLVLGETRRRAAPGDPGADAAPSRSVNPAAPDAIWCMKGSRRVRVDLADVFLFAAERDYVRLHTREHEYLVRGRLKDWTHMLPDGEFMQVHRSAIVRLNAIRGLDRAGSVWRIILPDGTATLVSRPKGKQLRHRLAEGPAVHSQEQADPAA